MYAGYYLTNNVTKTIALFLTFLLAELLYLLGLIGISWTCVIHMVYLHLFLLSPSARILVLWTLHRSFVQLLKTWVGYLIRLTRFLCSQVMGTSSWRRFHLCLSTPTISWSQYPSQSADLNSFTSTSSLHIRFMRQYLLDCKLMISLNIYDVLVKLVFQRVSVSTPYASVF